MLKINPLTESQKKFISENCHEMNISDLGRKLNVPRHHVYNYCRKNQLKCAKYATAKVPKSENMKVRDSSMFNVGDKTNWLF